MNTYDYIKDNITVPQAAERYGLSIGRGGMTCCLFHDDRHPSMKLNERYFYCFGCGAHGDVIDFTARLLGTTTKDTIQILLNDFGLDPDPGSPSRPPQPRRPAIYQLRQDEQRCFTVLTSFHQQLEDWKARYAPASPDDPLDDHYILACRQMDGIEYALDILTVGETEERVKLVDGLIKTGRLERLRQAVNDVKEGERYVDSRAS